FLQDRQTAAHTVDALPVTFAEGMGDCGPPDAQNEVFEFRRWQRVHDLGGGNADHGGSPSFEGGRRLLTTGGHQQRRFCSPRVAVMAGNASRCGLTGGGAVGAGNRPALLATCSSPQAGATIVSQMTATPTVRAASSRSAGELRAICSARVSPRPFD